MSASILPLCGWASAIAAGDARKRDEARAAACDVRELADSYPVSGQLGKAGESASARDGPRRLKSLMDALNRLDELGYRRSKGQRVFHKAFIGACLTKIYGGEIHADLSSLLRRFDLDRLKSDVIVQSPRRTGKTMGTALFAAAYIMTQKDASVSIFSTAQRASRKLLALIWQMVVKLAGTAAVVKTYNQETLEVYALDGTVNSCFSYPCRVQIDRVRDVRIPFFFCFRSAGIAPPSPIPRPFSDRRPGTK